MTWTLVIAGAVAFIGLMFAIFGRFVRLETASVGRNPRCPICDERLVGNQPCRACGSEERPEEGPECEFTDWLTEE